MTERIDLKQFEGLTEGPWEHIVPEYGWDDIMGANGETVSEVTLGNPVDGPAIAKLPDLIAELKRCYEELDLAHRNLSIVRNALARGYPDIEEEIWELIDASE
tara:strand:- start:53 stop:361 length:309 start_codon:yes stop_codon:yes gene_type:complete